jgi:hypothetical protein
MKILLTIFLLCLSFNAISQLWVLTPDGLRDSTDKRKKYVMIDCTQANLSAKQLYDRALLYLTLNSRGSGQEIRLKWDSVDIIFDTYNSYLFKAEYLMHYVPVEANYSTELRFYRGSVRYEIFDLDLEEMDSGQKMLIKGSPLSAHTIYNRHDKLLKPELKLLIEKYFNGELANISRYLNQP